MKYENVEATMADAIVNFPPPISLAIGDKRAVFVFPNGMVMVFDANGNQVPRYQGSAAKVIARLIDLAEAALDARETLVRAQLVLESRADDCRSWPDTRSAAIYDADAGGLRILLSHLAPEGADR